MPRRTIRRRSAEAGQAMVETALTMPLVVFMVLGLLQLFMMLQARIMAQYAAVRAVRAGSLNKGSCDAMNHTAIAALLPTFSRTDTPARVGAQFDKFRGNNYGSLEGAARNGAHLTGVPIVNIVRESPVLADIPGTELTDFDTEFTDAPRLEIRLVFWYPMRIPFANWVITRMALAHYGLTAYDAANPLNPVERNADWSPSGTMSPGLAARYKTWTDNGFFVFPIHATATMRMMTPPLRSYFAGGPGC